MAGAICSANERIIDAAREDPQLRGMGTTLVGLRILDSEGLVAHVGDSRAYRLRNGKLDRLTADHSWVEEQLELGNISEEQASQHPFRNVITRALGVRQDVEPELSRTRLEQGDTILLCSDGLNVMLDDDAILACLQQGGDLEETCELLVAEANRLGGHDNVTVMLVEIA